MRFRPTLQALACMALFTILYFSFSSPDPAANKAVAPEAVLRLDAQIAQLQRQLNHVDPRSGVANKLRERIAKRRASREGQPPAGYAEEFERILWEMKIPADRTAPEYGPGYRKYELDRAVRMAKAGPLLPWVSRGPGNVSGRARGLIVDPTDPSGNTWWVGSAGGGVWKTTDAGATWTVLTDGMPNLPMSTIAMSPSNPNVIYAGTGESFFNIDTINGNGIIKSVDGGATWSQIASTVDDPRFNNIARIIVDPADAQVLVVAATTGRYKESVNPSSSILRSTDGGSTWTEVYTETDLGSFNRVKKVQQVIADPTDFNIQYAAIDEKGILKSTDGGQTWALSNNGIPSFNGRFELAISPVNSNYIFASAEGGANSELYVSIDKAGTWIQTAESGTEPNWLGAQGWYDNTIVCHPTNPAIVYVGGIQLWKIQFPGGVGTVTRNTSLMNTGPVHVDNHNLKIINPGGSWRILNSNDGGIGVSSSQDTGWSKPTNGLVTTQFYGVDKRPGASAYFGGMQDNGTWFSAANPTSIDPWTFAIGGDGYETSWHFNDPQKMIGGYQYNGLIRSLDGGETWIDATGGGTIDSGAGNAPFITKIGKSNLDPELLFAVGAQGVWRSTDFGGSWTLSAIPSSAWGSLSSFHDVRVSRASAGVVWAGARMDGTAHLQVSTDGGLTFASTSDYGLVTMGGISGLATDPHDANTAYALFSFAQRPKILKTTDLGATWTDISGFGASSVSSNGFPDVAVYDLLVFSDDPNHIWVATEIGLVESTDGGLSWALANNGLPNVGIWRLIESEDEIVIGTHGRGIWSVQIPNLIANQTFAPLLERVTQGPSGFLDIDLNLRSVYDSTQVFVDGSKIETLPANAAHDLVTASTPVTVGGTKIVSARGFRGGVAYDSVSKSVDTVVMGPPVYQYANDFNGGVNDFFGNGFSVATVGGFSDPAVHTTHPYPDKTTFQYQLTVPIRVAGGNATVEFDEVVIVEPGDPGVPFGQMGFWDYVIVEGSTDGANWVPLANGYDSRFNTAWLNAYNSGTNGSSLLFRHHSFDLLSVFQPYDVVLLRWRLVADESVTGWGWAFDNLQIQMLATPAPSAPSKLQLSQNMPNPFNPKTEISYNLPVHQRVSIQVYDLRGRLVRTLVDEEQSGGAHTVTWNGRDNNGSQAASGVYLYQMVAGDQVLQKKMLLVK